MARNYRRNYSKDPMIIKAKFDSVCSETGKKISKGEECVYYPLHREVFCMDSKQAYEFKNWKMDIDCFGCNY